MATETRMPVGRSRFLTLLLTAMTALVILVGFANDARQNLRHVTDDWLWLQYSGLSVFRDHFTSVLDEAAGDYVRDATTPDFQWRYQLRRDYTENYLAASAVYFVTTRLTKKLVTEDYALYAANALHWMFVAGFLAALTIFAAFLARVVSRDPAMGYAVFAAMAATVLLDTLEPGPYVWLMGSSASFLADLPAVLLNPGAGLSPFFITPRGQFSLLVCLVFLARWRGRFDLAYLLLACLAFLHQSQAALHCGALVAIDLICRPGVLVTSRVWPSLALAAVLFVTRDAVIDSVFAVDPKISVLAMLAVFAFAAYWGSTTARRAVDRLAVALWRRLAWLRRREIVVADALCIMTLWLMMIPAILIIEDTLFPVRSAVYFWGQVNTRLWAAYRTVVLMALFWLLFRRLLSLYGDRFLWPASAAAAVAVLAMFIVFQPQQALLRAQPALVESARHYERTLEEARRRPQAAPFPYRETVLYYALVKSVETQQDWLSALSQRHDPRLRDRGLKPLPPVSD